MRGNIGRILSIVATAILMVPTTVAQSRENPPTPGTAVLGVRSAKSYAQLAPNTTTGGIQRPSTPAPRPRFLAPSPLTPATLLRSRHQSPSTSPE